MSHEPQLACVTEGMPEFLRKERPRTWLAQFGDAEPVPILRSSPEQGRYGSWEEAVGEAKSHAEFYNVGALMALTLEV